jgi:hypothetical protein
MDELIKSITEIKLKLSDIQTKTKKFQYLNSFFCLNNVDVIRAFIRKVESTCVKAINKLQDYHTTENQKYVLKSYRNRVSIKNIIFKNYK